ncbi:NAD(P)-dependent oxidoreductase [Candidatus Kaiserbacteria bacterium]|nr:NAD(P)-dependent oxidoreductase [Candidatus Kaiserbacteria bacterium]
MNRKTVFIVGGAGYVGAMLCEQFSQRGDVEKIIALDKEPQPEAFKENSKITWVSANTSDGTWQGEVSKHNPDVVVHTAWQIREMYGQKKLQWKWNVEGSDAVFDFAFSTPSVKKLIYFSTVSSYGASSKNTFEHYFKEEEPFIESEYLYGVEKKVVEEHLHKKFVDTKSSNKNTPQIFIVRPAAITGPRGRFMRIRFGLQSALSGQLKESIIHRVISLMVSFVPATKGWVRQFIHEDDVTDIVGLFAFNDLSGEYEVFNISPPGEPVYSKDMAHAVGKRVLPIFPWMVRLAFFFFWHVTRGRVPTSEGGWKFYSYPILVDGSRITKQYDFTYSSGSKEAFYSTKGRYEEFVPEESRR